MSKELEFLHIQEGPAYKQQFIQHITEMINIPLKYGENYESMFESLRERFKDIPEKLEVVESWIQFQYEGQDDKDLFKKTKILGKKDKERNMYAVFNMYNL